MNRRTPRIIFYLALLTCLLLGTAVALDYRVDPAGGPERLAEAVEAAFAQWLAVEDSSLSVNETAEARNLITYGDGTKFGPDTLSLTVSKQTSGAQQVTVLINPEAADLLGPVLLYETGLLIGLRATVNPSDDTAESVMSPALAADSSTELSESDVKALQDLGLFPPEDINRDGVVNFYDLVALAEAYGRAGVNVDADINGDGSVDDLDLARLREAYIFGAPSETDPFAVTTPPETEAEETTGEIPTGELIDELLEPPTPEGAPAEDEASPDSNNGNAESAEPDGDDTSIPDNSDHDESDSSPKEPTSPE